jgi:hypothetical protein
MPAAMPCLHAAARPLACNTYTSDPTTEHHLRTHSQEGTHGFWGSAQGDADCCKTTVCSREASPRRRMGAAPGAAQRQTRTPEAPCDACIYNPTRGACLMQAPTESPTHTLGHRSTVAPLTPPIPLHAHARPAEQKSSRRGPAFGACVERCSTHAHMHTTGCKPRHAVAACRPLRRASGGAQPPRHARATSRPCALTLHIQSSWARAYVPPTPLSPPRCV